MLYLVVRGWIQITKLIHLCFVSFPPGVESQYLITGSILIWLKGGKEGQHKLCYKNNNLPI